MKKLIITTVMAFLTLIVPAGKASAQFDIPGVISAGVTKVINAVDLSIQRMQNETEWLQNAQKQLENILSETKLTDIADWVQKQKDLYGDYFDELWQVKEVITYYHRVKNIADKQVRIVDEYSSTFKLFKQDTHFTADEISYMDKVYNGIIDASLKNLDQVFLVIDAFTTQMSDEKRMQIIDDAGDAIDKNYSDLKQFNNQNKMVSLQRSKDAGEAKVIMALYGL